MAPAFTGGKRGGNLEMDLVFKGAGRIRKSLGTKSRRLFYQRVALLRKVEKREGYEILRAFKDDKITIEQLVEADLAERLGASLDVVKLSLPLWDEVERTLRRMARGHATRQRYARSLRALQRKGKQWLGDNARVSDLELVEWNELHDEWGESATDWMHLRRAVSRFLSRYLDLYHPFRRRVMLEIPTATVHPRQPDITLDIFEEVVAKIPEHLRKAYWAILVLGVRDGSEYVWITREDLIQATHVVKVPGSKNRQSFAEIEVDVRWWPLITSAIPSPARLRWLQDVWKKACDDSGHPGLHIHDLRHLHGQLALDEGVLESDVQSSYRHKSPGQTRTYVLRNASGRVSAALADHILPKPKKLKRRGVSDVL
jgi:integrase